MTELELCLTIRASFGRGAIAQLGERCSGTAEVGGSIPPSSTIKNARILNKTEGLAFGFLFMKNIARLGQIVFIIGLILTVVGLIFGFWFMFQGNDEWATKLLFAVPVGFMFLFTGLATSVMFSPRDDSSLNEKRSLQDLDDD